RQMKTQAGKARELGAEKRKSHRAVRDLERSRHLGPRIESREVRTARAMAGTGERSRTVPPPTFTFSPEKELDVRLYEKRCGVPKARVRHAVGGLQDRIPFLSFARTGAESCPTLPPNSHSPRKTAPSSRSSIELAIVLQ